ncbi:MAG: hypothetical protein ABI451_02490 [Dokdonella sp.]
MSGVAPLVLSRQLSGRTGAASLPSDFERLISRLTTGLIFVDSVGGCVAINSRAEKLLAENLGMWLTHGRLRARKPESERLDKALLAALATIEPTDAFMLIRDAKRRPTILLAINSFNGMIADQPVAAMIVLRAVSPPVSNPEQKIAQLFELSSAEASLLWALFDVGDLADACRTLGKAIATGRSQLRSILAKTQCQRQSQLFQLIAAATSIISYD